MNPEGNHPQWLDHRVCLAQYEAGDPEADDRGGGGEHERLGEELPENSLAARAEGAAYCDLAEARRGPSIDQYGHVRAHHG